MTDVERLKVRAETLEELAHRIEANPREMISFGTKCESEIMAAEIADQIRSRASDARFRARQLERRHQIAAQHVAEQMAQI